MINMKPGFRFEFTYKIPQKKTVPYLYPES